MDFIGCVEQHTLLNIKTERIEELDLPAKFEGLVDKPSKCGDIFAFNEGRYLFCCSFCQKTFEEIENFIKHVEENHSKLVEDSISMPQLDGSSNGNNDVAIDPKVEVEYVDMPICAKWEPELANEDSESGSESGAVVAQDSKQDARPTCEICGKIYNQNSSLGRHRRLQHPIEYQHLELKKGEMEIVDAEKKKQDPKFACEICDKKYYSDSGLRRHRTKNHPVEYPFGMPKVKKIYKCNYCNRTCKSNSVLVAHERTHTGEAPFQCSVCLKCFTDSSQLKLHQRTHTGERPHKCTHCPSAFSCRSNLLSHIRSHLGDRRYKCDECGKGFITSTCLKTHIRSHTGERPYQCEQCGIKCTTASALSFHKKQRHLKYKNHECQICGKRFLTGTVLRGHMRTHSDERPFECSICSATFRDRKSFTAHLKLHSDVKEYVCKICGKEFAQGPGLYSHMKSHGFNKSFKEPPDTGT